MKRIDRSSSMSKMLGIGICAFALAIGCGSDDSGSSGNDASNDASDTTGEVATEGTVIGTISYNGDNTGALFVAAYESTTVTGPPPFMIDERMEDVKFPVEYTMTVALEKELYVMFFFDVNGDNPMMPGTEDYWIFHDEPVLLTPTDHTAVRDITLVDP